MQVDNLDAAPASEANEAVTDEAQTPEIEQTPEKPSEELEVEQQPEITAESQPETAAPQEAEKTEQLSPSQIRRRNRKERFQEQQRELEAAKAEAERLSARLSKYEEVDPNTAEDYDAAVQQNAVNRALKTRDKQDAEDAQKRAEQIEQTNRQERVKSFIDDGLQLSSITDFVEKVTSPAFQPAQDMAEAIMGMDRGPEVAYHLANNPEKTNELNALPPMQRAIELGRLEASLPQFVEAKKSTSAPAPIAPVSGNSSVREVNLETATIEEYMAARGYPTK